MVDVSKLSAEERAKLMEELKKEEEIKENAVKMARENYKELVNEVVLENFNMLVELSELLASVKGKVFDSFYVVMDMKEELYGIKDGQQSHTFTSNDGKSITIGYRVLDNFDDTVHAGIEKVKKWVYGLADGARRAEIEAVIDTLMKRDKNGNLKASRVLELKQLAEKVNDKEFSDGVKIIEEAYKPVKSSNYVAAYYKDKDGKKVNIPLSTTSAE